MAEKPRVINIGWFGSGGGIYTFGCPLVVLMPEADRRCLITADPCDFETTKKLPRGCPLRKGEVRVKASELTDYIRGKMREGGAI